MKNLPIYAKTLLLQGASTVGNFTEGYYYVEENLQSNHANKLFDFCKWIDENIGGASQHNIDMLFSAFENPRDEYLTQQANNLAELIKSIKRSSEKPKCEHKRTYVAVRHVSGIRLVKCSDCGANL